MVAWNGRLWKAAWVGADTIHAQPRWVRSDTLHVYQSALPRQNQDTSHRLRINLFRKKL